MVCVHFGRMRVRLVNVMCLECCLSAGVWNWDAVLVRGEGVNRRGNIATKASDMFTECILPAERSVAAVNEAVTEHEERHELHGHHFV